jgi:hypothetical protein
MNFAPLMLDSFSLKGGNLMAPWNKILHSGVLGALLLTAFNTSAVGQAGGAGGAGAGAGGSVGGETRSITQFGGRVLCRKCSLEEMQAKQAEDDKPLYELVRDQERAVLKLETVNNARQWDDINLSRSLQVRGEEELWQKLTAAENLRKEVALTGILRPTGTLDLSTVTFTDGASRPEEGVRQEGMGLGRGGEELGR